MQPVLLERSLTSSLNKLLLIGFLLVKAHLVAVDMHGLQRLARRTFQDQMILFLAEALLDILRVGAHPTGVHQIPQIFIPNHVDLEPLVALTGGNQLFAI